MPVHRQATASGNATGGERDPLQPFLDPAPLPPGPSLIGIDAPAEPADPESLAELGLDALFLEAETRAEGCDLGAWYRALPIEEAVTAARLAIARVLLEDAGTRRALARATTLVARARALVPTTPRSGADRMEDRGWLAALLAYGDALDHFAEAIAALLTPTPHAPATQEAMLAALEARRAHLGPTLHTGAVLAEELGRVRVGLDCDGDVIVVRSAWPQPVLADELRRLLRPLVDDAEPLGRREVGELAWSRLAAEIVEETVHQHPALDRLRRLRTRAQGFLDPWILQLERECRFFLALIDTLEARCRSPRAISIPALVPQDAPWSITEGWEVGLATERDEESCNSCAIDANRSLLVVTGANGAGKTTFARMVGQIAYLGALGLPIPARAACLRRVQRVDAAFSRPESLTDQGRLGQELGRLIELLRHRGPRLLVTNEIFASTTPNDGLALARSLLAHLRNEGALAVMVTFLDELANEEGTTSLVAGGPPAFEVVEGPPSAASAALALAAHYRLRASDIAARIHP